jgi:hypothetical protein
MSEVVSDEKISKTDPKKIKHISVGILVTLLILMVIYIIVIFVCFNKKTFIFAPYTPAPPPESSKPFYPLGEITPLSPEEICTKNINIYCSTDPPIEPSSYDPGIPTLDQCFKDICNIVPNTCDSWKASSGCIPST